MLLEHEEANIFEDPQFKEISFSSGDGYIWCITLNGWTGDVAE